MIVVRFYLHSGMTKTFGFKVLEITPLVTIFDEDPNLYIDHSGDGTCLYISPALAERIGIAKDATLKGVSIRS